MEMKKFPVELSLILRLSRLVAFVSLLFVISCSPLRVYREDPDVRAWEPEIQKFEQLDAAKYYPEDAVMFAGSSSIRLWSTINRDMLPYNVIQRGYGGAKLSDFAVYAKRIIYPHKCSAIVLFIANDISGSVDDKSPSEVANLFRTTLNIIRRKHPDTPVFWISITPTPARWKVWPEIKEANEFIRKICKNNRSNTYYIDTEPYFLTKSGLPRNELFQDDRLHLNADGYALWSELIKNELNKVLRN